MRVQSINSNNYQNKNVGFEATNVHTLIRGVHCHAGEDSLCIEFAEIAATRLRQAAKDLRLMEYPNEAEPMIYHAKEGLHVWLINSRTRLAKDLYMANPGDEYAVLRAATDNPNIEMDTIQIAPQGLHRGASMLRELNRRADVVVRALRNLL